MIMADVSILVLVALFAATAIRSFNLGLAALPAAFLVGLGADLTADEVTAFFPGNFFVLIVGVTALFAIAQLTGTLQWLLDRLLSLVGGRALLVLLVPFLVGATLAALGTLPAAATAITAPIALGLAARYAISPLAAAVIGLTGILAGLLSPLAVYGITARQLGGELDLGLPDSAAVTLFAGGALAGVLVVAVWILVGTRLGAIPRGRLTPAGGPDAHLRVGGTESGGPGSSPTRGTSPVGAMPSPASGVTASTTHEPTTATEIVASPTVRTVVLTALLAVVVLSVGFDLNIGYLGLAAAVVLQLVLRLDPGEILARIPWNIVLLIGGLLTYVGLMQELGAFVRISEVLSIDGAPMLTLLVLCYIAAVTSFAASSIAVFVTTMPLVPAVVAEGVSPVGAVLALALASVLVDINPLGITGGLILGSAEPAVRSRLFRQLLIYGLASVVVAPPLVWLVFGWW